MPGVPGRMGRGREKQSVTSRSCTAGTGREVDMQRPDTGRQITTTSRGAHAAEGPENASGGHACCPLVRGEAKPGLSGAGTAAQLLGSLSFRGVGAQGPGLPESAEPFPVPGGLHRARF